MSSASLILKGEEHNSNVPKGSLGDIYMHFLLSKKSEEVAQIDSSTGKCVTYGTMLQNSIKLAVTLKNFGIRKDDVIVTICRNNIQFYMPCIAGIFLGAIINPINPAYTRREIAHAINISEPKIAFVDEDIAGNFIAAAESQNIKTLACVVFSKSQNSALQCLQEFMESSNPDIDGFEIERVDPQSQGALILSSSGTTGLPKGVLLTHENLRMNFDYFSNTKYGDANDKVMSIATIPFFHILGFMLYMQGMMLGMKLVVVSTFKLDEFLRIIKDYEINRLYVVPTLLTYFAKASLEEVSSLSKIRHVFCGGATLSEEVIQTVQRRFKCEVIQLYGMTELGAVVVSTPLRNTINNIKSIGCLNPGWKAKVWDVENKKDLGPNKLGELCFKSTCIMKCYVKNEEASNDIIDCDGFLHTGDLGYYDEKGFFYVVDRIKEILKYKGFQVPPAELEAILLTHEGVKEAAVVGIPDEIAGELPVAFVVKNPDQDITEEELIKFVAQNVSFQKQLHGGVRFIYQLPKNSVGKIMRKELRLMARNQCY